MPWQGLRRDADLYVFYDSRGVVLKTTEVLDP